MKRAYLTITYFISSCVRYLCNSIIILSSLTFNFVLSFILKLVRFKLRESIAPPIWPEYNLQTVKQCHPLEKKKLTKLKLVLIFSWFIDHNKLYPNYEDSNYKKKSLHNSYYVFHGRVTLFFANNFLTQRRITMKFLHNFI